MLTLRGDCVTDYYYDSIMYYVYNGPDGMVGLNANSEGDCVTDYCYVLCV